MSPWTCTQYHNMYTHKVRFHQDYSYMDRSFACYIFHNQLRGAICCITLSNIPSSHGALAMHISIIYLWFVMCWFCKIYKSKPGRLPVTGCGKAFWNRLVRTCRLLPRRTLLPTDAALTICSVKSSSKLITWLLVKPGTVLLRQMFHIQGDPKKTIHSDL